MSTNVNTAVRGYLDRLRQELAGLPAAEVEEIVQDVEPQVAAVAAEFGAEPSSAALADRLGDPAEYARELRSAMGLPEEPVAWRPPLSLTRTALGALVVSTVAATVAGYLVGRVMADTPRPALVFLCFAVFVAWFATGRNRVAVGRIAALPEVRLVVTRLAAAEQFLPVAGYLRSLRPAWLLLRAALTGLGVLWLCRWLGWYDPVPAVSAAAVAVLTGMLHVRAAIDRRWLWLSLPLSGWAAGVAIKAAELLPLLAAGDHVWP